jgi:hypothetical protein
MKYQLVIQFPETLFKDLDEIGGLEDRLDGSLLCLESKVPKGILVWRTSFVISSGRAFKD